MAFMEMKKKIGCDFRAIEMRSKYDTCSQIFFKLPRSFALKITERIKLFVLIFIGRPPLFFRALGMYLQYHTAKTTLGS